MAEINTDSADSRHEYRRTPGVLACTSSIEKPFVSTKNLMISRIKEGGETKDFNLVLQRSIYLLKFHITLGGDDKMTKVF